MGRYFDNPADLISEIREIRFSRADVGVGNRDGRGNRRRSDAANTDRSAIRTKPKTLKETKIKIKNETGGEWGGGEGSNGKTKEISGHKYH